MFGVVWGASSVYGFEDMLVWGASGEYGIVDLLGVVLAIVLNC